MSDTTCTCGRPVADAYVCHPCGQTLAQELATVRDLVADLELALARGTSFGNHTGGRGTDRQPLPYDVRASEALWVLRNTLGTWARIVEEENGQGGPEVGMPAKPAQSHAERLSPHPGWYDTRGHIPAPQIGSWLAARIHWLRHHAAAAEAFDELHAAITTARHVIDRPPDRWYAGPCDHCHADLYAKTAATTVACPNCGVRYDVHARRSWLLDAAEDVLAPAVEIARALTTLAVPVTDGSIRGYVHRKRLTVRTHDTTGRPLYRLGDVLDLVAGERARAS